MPLKLRAIRGDLLCALGRVNKVVSETAPMAILSQAVLRGEAGSRRLLVEGTDLVTGVSGVIVAEIVETGAIALPAAALHRILQNANDDVVELTIEDDVCRIKAGRSRWRLPCMPAGDHPGMPRPGPECVTMELDGDMLRRVLAAVNYATAKNDAMGEAIAGVLFRNRNQTLTTAATDRHRLAVANFALPADVPEFEHILSQSGVAALLRFLAETPGSVTIRVMSPYVYFTRVLSVDEESSGHDVTVMLKTIEGRYPPYERVISHTEDVDCRFMVPRNALVQSVRRVMAMVKERGEGVKLQIVQNRLRLSYEGNNWGAGLDEIEMDLIDASSEYESEGRSFPVCLNYQFLAETLGIIPTENAMVSMTSESGPFLLRGVIEGEEDTSILHVIMPIMPRKKF